MFPSLLPCPLPAPMPPACSTTPCLLICLLYAPFLLPCQLLCLLYYPLPALLSALLPALCPPVCSKSHACPLPALHPPSCSSACSTTHCLLCCLLFSSLHILPCLLPAGWGHSRQRRRQWVVKQTEEQAGEQAGKYMQGGEEQAAE